MGFSPLSGLREWEKNAIMLGISSSNALMLSGNQLGQPHHRSVAYPHCHCYLSTTRCFSLLCHSTLCVHHWEH